MQSEAKRRENAKYNAKCDQITIRPLQPEGERIQAAAGQSLQGFVLDAVRARMSPQTEGDSINLRLSVDAVAGLEHEGETSTQAAARLLAEAIRQARQGT